MAWSDATLAAARRLAPDATSVAFDWRDYAGGGAAALPDDGWDFAFADEVLRRAAALSHGWFRAGGEEHLIWEGATAGAALAADLFAFFQTFVKADKLLAHILTTYGPGEVAFVRDGSVHAAFLETALPARGVRTRPLGRGGGLSLWERLGRRGRRWAWPLMWETAGRHARAGTRPAGEPRPGAVVFWGQFGGFEAGVYERLLNAWGKEMPFVAGTIAAGKSAAAAGLPYTALFDRLPPPAATNRAYRALAADYRGLERRGLFEGFGAGPGVAAALRARFPFRPDGYLVTPAMLAAAAAAWLDRVRPALIVHMGDAHLTGRLITTLAAGRGVPTLALQHHITGGPTFGYLPLSSSLLGAWGDESRDWLVAGGAPAERTRVVGSTYAAVVAGRYRLAAPSERRDVVVATNNFDCEENRAVARACAPFAASRADLTLVFRPHPSEGPRLYRNIIAAAGVPNARVAADAPLADVMARAAVIVSGHSGVGVDAVLAGVPFIHYNLMKGVPDYIPYVKYGAALPLDDVAALPAVVAAALNRPAAEWEAGRRAFAAAYLGTAAGDPFANAAALMRELLGGK